jgi:hypothetical protein
MRQNRLGAPVALACTLRSSPYKLRKAVEASQASRASPKISRSCQTTSADRIDAQRNSQPIQLDTDALGNAVKQPNFALDGLEQLQALAGGLDCSQIGDLGFDGHGVTHGNPPVEMK